VGEHGFHVHADELWGELRVAGDLGVHHRLGQWTQAERIGGGDEVDRAAHHDDADDRPGFQHPRQLRRVEAVEP